jgi:hypothetical protein
MDRDHPPQPRLTLSIGVIGHRPERLPAAKLGQIEAEVDRVISLIAHEVGVVHRRYAKFFQKGRKEEKPQLCVVSALAEGADSIVAKAALSRGFVLDVPIPFLRTEYLRDFDTAAPADNHAAQGPAPLEQFTALEGQARSLLQLPGERLHGECADKRIADKAYEMAGLTVIGQSDILLAVWDSGPSGGPGGTADMLPLAVRRGVPIVEINVSDICNTRIRWSSLRESPIAAEHIEELPSERFEQVLPRLIEEFLRPPSTESERDALLSYLGGPPKEFWRNALAQISRRLGFPRRRAARAKSLAAPFCKLMKDTIRDENHPEPADTTLLAEAFGWADVMAVHYAKIFRFAYLFNFSMSALAVIAALSSLLVDGFWPPGIEICLIILVLCNTSVGRRFGWHMRWMEARELAERMRVAILFWILGAQPPAFFGEEPAWTGWYARAIIREQGMRRGRLDRDGMSAARTAMLEVLERQCQYHRKNAHLMKRREDWLERAGQLFFGMTLVLAVVHGWGDHLLEPLYHYIPDHQQIIIMLSAVLPTLATAMYGIRVMGDFEGRAKRSERTELAQLRVIEALLRDPSDLILFRARAQVIADAMLGDVSSWRLSAESRGLAIPG